MPAPNLIFFVVDQWRGDVLGHLGNSAAHTPNLDAWVASSAVSFRHAFIQNPVCTPSRCSFMTGWYSHVRGHRTIYHMLQPDEPMLLRSLKQAGYYVWWGGKNDVVPAQYGFDAFCDFRLSYPDRLCRRDLHSYNDWRGAPDQPGFYSFYAGRLDKPANYPADEPFYFDMDWHTVLSAIDFLADPPTNQPWCLYINISFPHPPYGVEEPWYSLIDRHHLPHRIPAPPSWEGKPAMLTGIYENQNLQSWGEDQWDELRATYYGMCARTDHQFGLLLDRLNKSGLNNSTAIFFFSDHGDFAGDYGLVEKSQNTFEDCLVCVPFLVKPPAWIPIRPGIRDALIELVDFSATVEDLVGLPSTHTHFGRSLLPLIAGDIDTHRTAVFCEGGRIQGEIQAMETLDEKQGRNWLYWPRLEVQHRSDAAHTKAVMCRTAEYKYVYRLYEQDELYDLRSDPQELHNRIADPGLENIRQALKDCVLEFLLGTGDNVPHQLDRR